MQQRDLFFVIPTYRLREVGETVERLFASSLHKAFDGFEPDFFHHEICYFQKGRKGLPQVRVNNERKRAA